MNNNKKYSAIILSAGKSERMGIPKFSLMFDAKKTFLEQITNQFYSFGCEEIIVVVNPEGNEVLSKLNLNLPMVVRIKVNEHPEWERFYSLKIAAGEIKLQNSVFVSNIDNPFVTIDLLKSIANGNADYIYPTYKGKGGHPFLLSEKIIQDLTIELAYQIHLKKFLSKYSKLGIEVDDERILININTVKEYNRLFCKPDPTCDGEGEGGVQPSPLFRTK